jgi:type II restriction/modification system DNA methylase subunit YeeA
MSDFVQQQNTVCEFSSSDAWIILSPIEQSIKRKIEAVGTPLKDWNINIYRGVLTGYNDAFIISTEKRNEILDNCQTEDERQRTAELIRPILRGRDIKRYGYVENGLYLINTHNGIRGKIPRIRIEEYPSIKAHLDQYWDKIEKRADQGDTPYNLRNCAYLDDFSKPKIVWGNLNLKASFALVEDNSFINAPSPMIVPANNYLLGILNSKLADYYIRRLGVTRNGGYFEYKPMFIEQLPVPVDCKFKTIIEEAVNKRDERQIDKIIYIMYGLSSEEIHYIESRDA